MTPPDPNTLIAARTAALDGAHSLSLKSELAKGKGKAASIDTDSDLCTSPIGSPVYDDDTKDWAGCDPSALRNPHVNTATVGQGSQVHRPDRARTVDETEHESFNLGMDGDADGDFDEPVDDEHGVPQEDDLELLVQGEEGEEGEESDKCEDEDADGEIDDEAEDVPPHRKRSRVRSLSVHSGHSAHSALARAHPLDDHEEANAEGLAQIQKDDTNDDREFAAAIALQRNSANSHNGDDQGSDDRDAEDALTEIEKNREVAAALKTRRDVEERDAALNAADILASQIALERRELERKHIAHDAAVALETHTAKTLLDEERLGRDRASLIAAQQTPPRDTPPSISIVNPSNSQPDIIEPPRTTTIGDVIAPSTRPTLPDMALIAEIDSARSLDDFDPTNDDRAQCAAERAAEHSGLPPPPMGPMRSFVFPSPPPSSLSTLPSVPGSPVELDDFPHAAPNATVSETGSLLRGTGHTLTIPGGGAWGRGTGLSLSTRPPFSQPSPPLKFDVDMGENDIDLPLTQPIGREAPRRNIPRNAKAGQSLTPTEYESESSIKGKRPRNESSIPDNDECVYLSGNLSIHRMYTYYVILQRS